MEEFEWGVIISVWIRSIGLLFCQNERVEIHAKITCGHCSTLHCFQVTRHCVSTVIFPTVPGKYGTRWKATAEKFLPFTRSESVFRTKQQWADTPSATSPKVAPASFVLSNLTFSRLYKRQSGFSNTFCFFFNSPTRKGSKVTAQKIPHELRICFKAATSLAISSKVAPASFVHSDTAGARVYKERQERGSVFGYEIIWLVFSKHA